MKRQVLLVAVLGLLGFFGGGCGPAVDDAEPQTSEQAPVENPAESDTPAAGNDEGTETEEREVEAFARNCQTTCSGIRATGESCGVVGFGSTSFLGGCTKACRFARSDASAKAVAAGCQLTTCADTCR